MVTRIPTVLSLHGTNSGAYALPNIGMVGVAGGLLSVAARPQVKRSKAGLRYSHLVLVLRLLTGRCSCERAKDRLLYAQTFRILTNVVQKG